MKKVLLILGALLMVLSGIAAVSAYEAHLINVTAHVENAMTVNKDHIHFGTVFPEEWITANFTVHTSGSFCEDDPPQTRMTHIDYEVWVEWKPIPEDMLGTVSPQVPGAEGPYYAWLGKALYIGVEPGADPLAADLVYVGANLTSPPGAQKVNIPVQTIDKDTPDLGDLVIVGLDVPVFQGYVNELTDPNPKPSGKNEPSWEIPVPWVGPWGSIANPQDGVDLGIDIKIQVVDIYKPIR
jgi:hypothetical protein